MSNCDNFCGGGLETNKGLIAINLIRRYKNKSGIIIIIIMFKNVTYVKEKRGFLCPLGFTHNPTTEKATKNVISNNGRNSICQGNIWK